MKGVRYPPAVKQMAYDLFMNQRITYRQIAERMKIPIATIRNWSAWDKWPEKRRQLVRDLEEDHRERHRRLVSGNLNAVVKRQLANGRALDNKIAKILGKDGDLTTEELMLVSRAYKNAADVQMKAVGATGKDSAQGSSVMVNVGLQPIGPTDVTSEVSVSEPSYQRMPTEESRPALPEGRQPLPF